ncbi:MAG: hypothetical protein IPJ00_22945 [Saprospirales bacterium]|nr:hypothetical protein [Saprospirales bacterium]
MAVSWHGANAYCAWMSEKTQLNSGCPRKQNGNTPPRAENKAMAENTPIAKSGRCGLV